MNAIGEIISIGTAFCWTVTVISFEYAGKRVGSLPVNIIRLVFAFVLLGLTLLVFRGSFLPTDATGYMWSMLLISGFIGLVIGDLFLFQAFVDVGGRISLLIMSSVPIISAVLAYYFLDETISLIDFVGIFITISAIGYVIWSRKPKSEPYHPHIKRGILFAFIGAFGQAVGLIFSDLGMADGYNAFAATQIRIIAAIIGFVIFIFLKRDWGKVGRAFSHKKAILFITLGSLFGPFLGVSSQLLAIQYTDIAITTTISQLNIIMIIPFSVFFFKEKVHIQEIIGAVVAFIGVVIIIMY